MPKPTSKPDRTAIVVVIITLDHHMAGVIERVRERLAPELPGLDLRFHALTSMNDPIALESCRRDIGEGDIVLANMFFLDEHVRAILPALQARHAECDAMICTMSAGEIMRLTRMGEFRMDGTAKGPMALLKRLRGKSKGGGAKQGGAAQLAMLRLMPKILAYIPGKAQDMRAYFLTMSYLLSGSTDNIADMVRLFVNQYADGPRRSLRGTLQPGAPRAYPETGVYHPRLPARISDSAADLPGPDHPRGTVGILVMRSYILAGDVRHYDRVIESFEARGFRCIVAFACGLDNRPAVEKFFFDKGRVKVDAVVSLTGFSLVGGPAFNDAAAAEQMLSRLDVPFVAAQPLEFQSVEQWKSSATGLTPVEATMMVAIPELDGAVAPTVYSGRSGSMKNAMVGIDDRIERLTGRVERMVRLRQAPAAERNVAIVLFNFPPNAGATGTAAHLSVFASLHRTLGAMRDEGYDVEVPPTVDALRDAILGGNASHFGADANVLARIGVDDHVRRTPHLAEIERQWGPAPGRHLAHGPSLLVLGARFGRVVVGIQPAFGYEGDPMRLMFEAGFSPTHAFVAFYRWLREDFGADVLLHFGTHGALEFMPGKHVGMSKECWPDRLLGDVPNVYVYASNNPSEGTIARRRSGATLVSYLTPPVTHSGLYRDLQALRAQLDRLRSLAATDAEALDLVPRVQAQAVALELASASPAWNGPSAPELGKLAGDLIELEQTLIPCGLHVFGEPMDRASREDYLAAIAECDPTPIGRTTVEALVAGRSPKAALVAGGDPVSPETLALCEKLIDIGAKLAVDTELPALMRALAGRFIPPAPGGDLLRNPAVLPTGRNLHGFDPFAIPSAFALREGARQADLLVRKHVESGHAYPRAVAIVLWGADNLKSGGGPIGQALALLGARPRLDSYGKLCGAELIPLAELGRPRIDVVMTLSGVFRDLLPMQVRLLAEAAQLAAKADEPVEHNFVRAHALTYMAEHGCDLDTAALRVFGNAENAYGANVNHMVDSGTWEREDELGDVFVQRKCFAYQPSGAPVSQRQLLRTILADVDLAYQNLESVELGVTTLDQYFDSLGGIARAARAGAAGERAPLPVYIGDQTGADERVRTLREQVALETRTRTLNPRWTEEMLRHGAEGVRHIEATVTNTLGWSATTAQVEPWVYREIARTYVLDAEMRERIAALNPKASMRLAQRLLEASERQYWQPDEETLAALEQAGESLEDRLEGAVPRVA